MIDHVYAGTNEHPRPAAHRGRVSKVSAAGWSLPEATRRTRRIEEKDICRRDERTAKRDAFIRGSRCLEMRSQRAGPSLVLALGMKQSIIEILKTIVPVFLAGPIACGGGDEYEPPSDYVAPEVPLEESQDSSSPCRGTPASDCASIDIEMCTLAGCELRYLEGQDTAICGGMAAPCDALTSREACLAVEGCRWPE